MPFTEFGFFIHISLDKRQFGVLGSHLRQCTHETSGRTTRLGSADPTNESRDRIHQGLDVLGLAFPHSSGGWSDQMIFSRR
jgi:hypothetical protein